MRALAQAGGHLQSRRWSFNVAWGIQRCDVGEECAMREKVFEARLWLPHPPEKVFPFFADAANLDEITPPWLHFKITCDLPILMREGAKINYSIRLYGIPIRWRTNISQWRPPMKFVDEQLSGPYRLWHHTHTFVDHNGGTLCTDRVRYGHWGGPIAERLFVRPNIEKIFAYRQAKLAERFGAAAAIAEPKHVPISSPG